MYRDPVGLPTIGYGTLIDTAEEEWLLTSMITMEEAEALLRTELMNMEYQITKMIQRPINQNQFDSLASFCYNLGTGNLRISTLLKKINANPSDPSIKDEFLKWHHAGGNDLTGLKRRRKDEADLYFTTGIDMT